MRNLVILLFIGVINYRQALRLQ